MCCRGVWIAKLSGMTLSITTDLARHALAYEFVTVDLPTTSGSQIEPDSWQEHGWILSWLE